MKLLSICIPNYNRLNCLKELVGSIIDQINLFRLEEDIEVCVSDDYSTENPDEYMMQLQQKYPEISIRYQRNDKNQGMDYNFCKSVEISHGIYCWIMGNDDLLLENTLKNVVSKLIIIDQSIDIIVTPFESYSYDGRLLDTLYPLGKGIGNKIYHMNRIDERESYFYSIKHNCGLFAFLSSVIFKRERWVMHGEMFQNKMNSIFIQVYMHMQTVIEGAVIWHLDEFITKNRMDEQEEHLDELLYKITTGLYNAIDFFFEGDLKKYLWNTVLWEYPYRRMLASDLSEDKKSELLDFKIENVELLKKIFLFKIDYHKVLDNKQIIIFGTGSVAIKAIDILKQNNFDVAALCDNNKKLWGKEKEDYKIISPNELKNFDKDNIYIIIASSYYMEIYKQLIKENNYSIIVIC